MYISLAFAVWAAFDYYQALFTFILLTASMPLLWVKMRMVITVDSELRIDRAHIELQYLKGARALDKDAYRKLRSVNYDARSYHTTRPWLTTGVQVFVNDERDQTSYWLIGTKKGEELVAALKN